MRKIISRIQRRISYIGVGEFFVIVLFFLIIIVSFTGRSYGESYWGAFSKNMGDVFYFFGFLVFICLILKAIKKQ